VCMHVCEHKTCRRTFLSVCYNYIFVPFVFLVPFFSLSFFFVLFRKDIKTEKLYLTSGFFSLKAVLGFRLWASGQGWCDARH
jgi:hypothetical protein